MEQTTNKKEIIKRLNQAFKNGDLEFLEAQDTTTLLKLLNALSSMRYVNVGQAGKTLCSIVGVSND